MTIANRERALRLFDELIDGSAESSKRCSGLIQEARQIISDRGENPQGPLVLLAAGFLAGIDDGTAYSAALKTETK
jgi:hypothetical protein